MDHSITVPPGDVLSAQIELLRRRRAFPIEGDVCLRGEIEGYYADGWTDGKFSVTIESARRVSSLAVVIVVPDWWPDSTCATIDIDGLPFEPIPLRPGRYEFRCDVDLRAGRRTTIRLRTSNTVFQQSLQRHLGVYIGLIRFTHAGDAPFDCNICGTHCSGLAESLDPEGSSCAGCQSNIRQRALAYLLGEALWARTLTVGQFQRDTTTVGIGVSDSPLFARQVGKRIRNYTNTQYDSALAVRGVPFLDITKPAERFLNTANFVTCSEVLEHVEPPVQKAFEGLYSVLRPGGALILTVPYTLEKTVEHYPNLHKWHLERRGDARVLVNQTAAGDLEELMDLRFHGGGEDVLEMRVFGLEDIFQHLKDAGFTDIRVRDENVLDYGIFFKYNWGLPITARRPSGS